VTAKLSL